MESKNGAEKKVILCSNHFRVYAGWNSYAFNVDNLFWNGDISDPDFLGYGRTCLTQFGSICVRLLM